MKITVREMAEAAMLVALAILLDLPFLKIKVGASGGSISFTMVPLFILAYRHGPLKGFIYIGIIYSFLSCVLDGEPFYSLPFDYVLGYGSIAVAGLFRKFILKDKLTFLGFVFLAVSIISACVLRTLSSTISSIIFYDVGFWEGFVYNILYIGPACLVTIVTLLALYDPLLEINKRYPIKSN